MDVNVQRIRIDQISIGDRFRKDDGDLDSLATSIREIGLQQPIIVCRSGTGFLLCAGQRRLRAVRDKLGESMIEARVLPHDDEVARRLIERDENRERKDPTPSEKVALAKHIESLLGDRRGRPAQSEEKQEQMHLD
jgi:ParB family chromosome partitioning protein